MRGHGGGSSWDWPWLKMAAFYRPLYKRAFYSYSPELHCCLGVIAVRAKWLFHWAAISVSVAIACTVSTMSWLSQQSEKILTGLFNTFRIDVTSEDYYGALQLKEPWASVHIVMFVDHGLIIITYGILNLSFGWLGWTINSTLLWSSQVKSLVSPNISSN